MGDVDDQEKIMTRFKLAAIAIAAATIATPALAAQQTYRQPVHRSAVVTPAPMLGYAWEPMTTSSLNTPNATGGGTFGYNQSLETPAN
jgi:hypothetical protein